MDRPSGIQEKANGCTERGRSIVLTGSPPSRGTRPSLGWLFACSSVWKYATVLPSGEIVGDWEARLVNCTGDPPSMPIFQMLVLSERSDMKTNERPSAEDTGDEST